MKEKVFFYLISPLLLIVFMSCGSGGESKKKFQTDTPRNPLSEYTLEQPGEWAGLEDSHAPIVELRDTEKDNIIIRVHFPIKRGHDHFIEKIGIMDEKKNDLFVEKFNRSAEYYEAKFTLHDIKKGYKAFVKCSLHDLWTAPLKP